MADRKISDLTALTTPASGDYLPIVDISEAAAASKNKRITIEELMRGVPNGTAAAPGIAFETDPNTGIYSPGADQLAVATNGTQRLTVDTAATTSTLPVVHPLGAVGTPSITFTGDLNTGFYSPAADTLAAVTAGSNRLHITSGGLVGIGVSAPGVLLDVGANGTAIIRASNTNPGLSEDVLIGGYEFHKADASGSGAGVVGAIRMRSADSVGSSAYMTFSTALGGTANDAERVRITGAGLVGIGDTGPDALLTVNGVVSHGAGSASAPSIAARGDLNTGAFFPAADTFGVATGGSERARIDSSGRLLVGTSTSVENVGGNLQVNGGSATINTFTANSAAYRLYFVKSRSGTFNGKAIVQSGDDLGRISFNGDDGVDYSSEAASIACQVDGTPSADDLPGRLVFSTTADGAATPTERLRITSAGVLQIADAGNITVGTTTGTKIGTATTQKIGFYNATPVVQPTAVADATDAASGLARLNDLLARLRTLGIIAT